MTWSSYLYDIDYRLRVFLNKHLNGVIFSDDFDWNEYHKHYLGELEKTKSEVTQKLRKGDYHFEKSQLVQIKKVKPLHPNHRLLYETILQLKVKSAVEVGCGGGDHMHNLKVLNPKLRLRGLDISEEQLKTLARRSPELKRLVSKSDLTLPYSEKLPKAECVFSQAVVMHMHTANNHLVALSNMFKMSSKYVVLMERWTKHPFMDDIKFLHKEKMIPWKNIYFYFRRAEELKNVPHLMVVSNKKLKYELIKDYSLMR